MTLTLKNGLEDTSEMESEVSTEVQEVIKVKKTRKKKEVEIDSVYLKDYVGSGMGIGDTSVKKLEMLDRDWETT